MGRSQGIAQKANPTGPITSTFGRGQVQFFHSTTTWTIPAGVTAVRVRVWGGGANPYFLSGGKVPSIYRAGAGGGFAIKTVTGLTPGGTVTVTVPAVVATNGAAGGTCSFGAHVSATGGSASSSSATGGTGSSGDFNYTGGSSNTDTTLTGTGGGGVANLFGNGGDGDSTGQTTAFVKGRASGGGGNASGGVGAREGGGTAFARGGNTTGVEQTLPESGNLTGSLDLIGVGSGGAGMQTASTSGPQNGINGGGGGGAGSGQNSGRGGFPGGGSGSSSIAATMAMAGASGLIVVEF